MFILNLKVFYNIILSFAHLFCSPIKQILRVKQYTKLFFYMIKKRSLFDYIRERFYSLKRINEKMFSLKYK